MYAQTASAVLTTHDPASHATGAVVTGLIFGIVFALVLFVAVVAWWARRGGSDDPGDGGGGGGGGGGDPPDPAPSGPSWWPEFEREFAEHVASVQSGIALASPSQRRDHAPGDEQGTYGGGADDGRRAPAAGHPGLEPVHPVTGAIGCEQIAEQR
jgi:hypothetical protein